MLFENNNNKWCKVRHILPDALLQGAAMQRIYWHDRRAVGHLV